MRMLGHAHRALRHHTQALDFYAEAARAYRAAGRPVEAAQAQLGSIDALMYRASSLRLLCRGQAARRTAVALIRERREAALADHSRRKFGEIRIELPSGPALEDREGMLMAVPRRLLRVG